MEGATDRLIDTPFFPSGEESLGNRRTKLNANETLTRVTERRDVKAAGHCDQAVTEEG